MKMADRKHQWIRRFEPDAPRSSGGAVEASNPCAGPNVRADNRASSLVHGQGKPHIDNTSAFDGKSSRQNLRIWSSWASFNSPCRRP
jgi:hypothetical protein